MSQITFGRKAQLDAINSTAVKLLKEQVGELVRERDAKYGRRLSNWLKKKLRR